MSTRNERKRAAKARKISLIAAQKQAFVLDDEKQKAKADRTKALIELNDPRQDPNRLTSNRCSIGHATGKYSVGSAWANPVGRIGSVVGGKFKARSYVEYKPLTKEQASNRPSILKTRKVCEASKRSWIKPEVL